MKEDDLKRLAKDPDGLRTYEYIANHISDDDLDMDALVSNMIRVDATGQFVVSAARYLAAIDSADFAGSITRLVSAAIDKDREHRYLPDLISGLWGKDYEANAERLSAEDDNFRRIYKRLHSPAAM